MSDHAPDILGVVIDFGRGGRRVGRLGYRDGRSYFEYDEVFLESGLDISPLHLPRRRGLFSFEPRPFEGLPGVFNDSLPDGWGRLLFDRAMRARGILPREITPPMRLRSVTSNSIGALTYEPAESLGIELREIDLDRTAAESADVLMGRADDAIEEMLAMTGSSHGARPKATIGLSSDKTTIIHSSEDLPDDFENWIVKFPNSFDGTDAGAVEYVYSLIARDAGIDVPETHLFPSRRGSGYFAVKRFDRAPKVHVHSVSGLLHADHRTPSLDYSDILRLSMRLTRDFVETEKLFRLAAFNVLAHNRDDHAKNFSFLMDESGAWKLAPAYDLTFSSGPGGEQSTTVLGNGRPVVGDLHQLGKQAKLDSRFVTDAIERTRSALRQWRSLATEHRVLPANAELIAKKLDAAAS